MWDSLLHDVRAAIRGLASARAFTTLTIVALGLGLGANSAVFAVVNGVLLRPLPYEHPERLAMLWSENPRLAQDTNPLSPANFDDLKRMNQSFESLDFALSFIVRVGVQGQEDQGVVQILRVGSNLLPIVGALLPGLSVSAPTISATFSPISCWPFLSVMPAFWPLLVPLPRWT